MNATRYHHGDLRAVLLEEAERSIARDGVDKLSLRQIARGVGVSHGAPARHFRDKQALLDALALHGFEEMNRRISAAATPDSDYRTIFSSMAQAYMGFALEHPELLAVMYTTKHHPDASEQLRDAAHTGMYATEELVRAAILDGTIPAGDPAVMSRVAFASVHGIAMLASGDLLDGMPADTLLHATVDALWRGFVSAPPT